MKIKANNANSPIWKDVYSHSMLPEQLQPLYEMATSILNFGHQLKVTQYFYFKVYPTNVLRKSWQMTS